MTVLRTPPRPSQTDFSFTSRDGRRIACRRWDTRGPLRGVVQIAHGLGEHIGRYAPTIEALVSAGLAVYGNDHRGHGHTASSPAHLGDFGAGGFDLLVEDMVRLSRIARDDHQGVPFILMGHGLGSFAAQQYVLAHSREIDGLVLSGSGALDGLAEVAASVAVPNFLNRAFEPARTAVDWLSRDPAVVDAFMADPLCFAALQPVSFASFLAAAPALADPASLRRIRRDLPVYLFSGSEDPVGQRLEGVGELIGRYRVAGLRCLDHDVYAGGRHEMLNEINRDEVRDRLLAWIVAQMDHIQLRTPVVEACIA